MPCFLDFDRVYNIYAAKPDLTLQRKCYNLPKGVWLCLQANKITAETSGKNQMWNVQMTLKAYILEINI